MATTTITEVKPNVGGGDLDISKLDPDADGDGKVTALEKEIYAALKAADIDGSGTIGTGELYAVIGNLVTAKRQVKNLGKMIVALLIIIVLALGSIFAVSMLAGEAIKESKVNGATMTTPDGTSAVQVDTVESNAALWDLPAVDTNTLAKMKDLVFYADLTADARFGAWVEATFKVAGVLKLSNDVATIVTTSGETVTIRRTAQTGDLVMGGSTYPISDTCTGACSSSRRKLHASDASSPPSEAVRFTGPRRTSKDSNNNKRNLGFFSAPATSARQLQFGGTFDGALITTGSFTMSSFGAF